MSIPHNSDFHHGLLGKEEAQSYVQVEPSCHAGNCGMPNSLTAARADQAYAIQAREDERAVRLPQYEALYKELEQWEASRGR